MQGPFRRVPGPRSPQNYWGLSGQAQDFTVLSEPGVAHLALVGIEAQEDLQGGHEPELQQAGHQHVLLRLRQLLQVRLGVCGGAARGGTLSEQVPGGKDEKNFKKRV